MYIVTDKNGEMNKFDTYQELTQFILFNNRNTGDYEVASFVLCVGEILGNKLYQLDPEEIADEENKEARYERQHKRDVKQIR